MTDITSHIDCFQSILRDLKPTGEDGFEGLVRRLLSGFSNTSFRLATSGWQQGQDGQNFDDHLKVSFEAKRYKNAIPKNDVQSKVTELCAKTNGPDLWVLAATVPMGTQVRGTVEIQLEKDGVAFLCLDWCDPPQLPLFAALCANQSNILLSFEAIAARDKIKKNQLIQAIEAVKKHERYQEAISELSTELSAGSIGLGLSIDRNRAWIAEKLSDKHESRVAFGQVLAPNATAAIPLQSRSSLISQIVDTVFETVSEKPIFILGGEGHGKSWSFAQSYLSLNARPLTLILSTSNLSKQHLVSDVEGFLIQSLINQTGDIDVDKTRARWKRRIKTWKTQPNPSKPRLVIFVDGINQKPNLGWFRWIEKLDELSVKIGANLVVSSRTNFAKRSIFPRLYIKRREIKVPEWTESELESILKSQSLDRNDIEVDVFQTLRNPRLLSVAFETLGKKRIHDLAELNASRLLYEYVFAFSRENDSAVTPHVHMSSLSNHADIVLERLSEDGSDDLSVFSDSDRQKIESDLDAVSSERFFEPLEDSPELYRLKSDGLDLAIGIAILSKLKKAVRNSRDVNEELSALIDPVTALDRTSSILLSGCVAAVLDNNCPTEIQASLISSFLNIQNLDDDSYPAFQGLLRAAPQAALSALNNSYRDDNSLAHKDWILSALKDNIETENVFKAVSEHIHSSLRTYTLDPKVSVLARRSDSDRQEKIDQKSEEIKGRLDALTAPEKSFLENSLREITNVNLSELVLDCFYLLSGLPLVDFSESLFAWRFGASINASFNVPTNEFSHLLTFNTKDWAETREALLKCSMPFDTPESSDTTRWALRGLLWSTGAEEDFDRSVHIYESIEREPLNNMGPWRLIENYCDVDPCDPNADNPSNIDETIKKFESLDFSTIRSGRNQTSEGHFFSDAQNGLARFRSEEAFNAMQTYVRQVLTREESALKFGVFEFEKTPELISSSMAGLGSAKALELASGAKPNEGDDWVVSQLLLNSVFSHFDGETQLGLIEELDPSNPMLTSFEHTFEAALTSDIEAALNRALDANQTERILNLLSFLRVEAHARPQVSATLFRSLVTHENAAVKGFALAVLGDGVCDEVLEEFAQSAWSIKTPPDREAKLESWYGSRALVIAADKGFISHMNAATRISSPLFGSLSSRLRNDATKVIAKRIDIAIKKAIGFSVEAPLPSVEVKVLDGSEDNWNYLSLGGQQDNSESIDCFVERMNESAEDFRRRQEDAHEAYNNFENMLSKSDARILVDDIGRKTVKEVYAVDKNLVEDWAKVLLSEHYTNLSGLKNIILYVAEAISQDTPEVAVKLFRRTDSVRVFTNFSSGISKTPLQLSCLWNASDGSEMKLYRAERIKLIADDDDLAEMILAAQLAGKTSEIMEFINSELQSGQPSRQARAITITGFLDRSAEADALLDAMSKRTGLLGRAYKSARYAYERNIWARHWFGELAASDCQQSFWKNGVLVSKIVDGRIDLWRDEHELSETAKKFGHGLTMRIQSRIEKWAKKRDQKLFGEKLPDKVFIY